MVAHSIRANQGDGFRQLDNVRDEGIVLMRTPKREIDEKMNRKLIHAAKEFFKDCEGDDDYPHQHWEEQYKEFKNLYLERGISDEFIDFICQGVNFDTPEVRA
jgi:hypothetical protein